MLGMHRHGELLGGNDEERSRRERAAREHAATLEMEDGGAAGLSLKPAGTHVWVQFCKDPSLQGPCKGPLGCECLTEVRQ